MSYTVSVAATYRVGCPTCTADAERLAVTGIRDKQVTSLTLRAIAKCDHVDPPNMIATPHSMELLPGISIDSPSDTNGFDWSNDEN